MHYHVTHKHRSRPVLLPIKTQVQSIPCTNYMMDNTAVKLTEIGNFLTVL